MSHSVSTTGQMGCSFFSSPTVGDELPHTLHSALSVEQELSAGADTSRRNSPHMDGYAVTPISDVTREELIRMRGALIEYCMGKAATLPEWQAAIYKAEAHVHEECMRHLIANRSAAQVARMEAERGLA